MADSDNDDRPLRGLARDVRARLDAVDAGRTPARGKSFEDVIAPTSEVSKAPKGRAAAHQARNSLADAGARVTKTAQGAKQAVASRRAKRDDETSKGSTKSGAVSTVTGVVATAAVRTKRAAEVQAKRKKAKKPWSLGRWGMFVAGIGGVIGFLAFLTVMNIFGENLDWVFIFLIYLSAIVCFISVVMGIYAMWHRQTRWTGLFAILFGLALGYPSYFFAVAIAITGGR